MDHPIIYPKCVTDSTGKEWNVSDSGQLSPVVKVSQEYPKWVEGFGIVPDAETEQKLRAGTHQPTPNPVSATGSDPVVRHVVPAPVPVPAPATHATKDTKAPLASVTKAPTSTKGTH